MAGTKTTKPKIYLDASYLTATILSGHSLSKKAESITRQIWDAELYLSMLTIDELLYSLNKYIPSRVSVTAIIQSFLWGLNNTNVIVNQRDLDGIKDYLYIYENSRLRPRDCMHLYYMNLAEVSAIATMDKDFKKLSKKFGIKVI